MSGTYSVDPVLKIAAAKKDHIVTSTWMSRYSRCVAISFSPLSLSLPPSTPPLLPHSSLAPLFVLSLLRLSLEFPFDLACVNVAC